MRTPSQPPRYVQQVKVRCLRGLILPNCGDTSVCVCVRVYPRIVPDERRRSVVRRKVICMVFQAAASCSVSSTGDSRQHRRRHAGGSCLSTHLFFVLTASSSRTLIEKTLALDIIIPSQTLTFIQPALFPLQATQSLTHSLTRSTASRAEGNSSSSDKSSSSRRHGNVQGVL